MSGQSGVELGSAFNLPEVRNALDALLAERAPWLPADVRRGVVDALEHPVAGAIEQARDSARRYGIETTKRDIARRLGLG